MKPAKRVNELTSAIFTEINRRKREVEATGLAVIDLGIGSPDQPPSPKLVEALVEAVRNPLNYRYPTSEGMHSFREAVARWCHFRFGLELDPRDEVLALMGSQDGLAHLAQAWIDPGDIVLAPDPGYPIYAASVALAGGEVVTMPLREEHHYLPDLEAIPTDVCARAKLMILNYPNNPLAATADPAFFERVIAFAKKHQILVAHDFAYSELAFDGYRPTSILEVDGAKQVAIEFNSLSKSFNMAGCRIAYAIGSAELLKPLAVVKSNIDYGVFTAVQQMAVEALQTDLERTGPNPNANVYERRRDVFLERLAGIGWEIPKPKATMFIWARVPEGWRSSDFAFTLLEKAGVAVIPGNAFGAQGEGYVRMALVHDEQQLIEATRRIEQSGLLASKPLEM
ncbi:LL-diaminopimelate aminotransferase [Ammoniphilus oxalaticus]|uniref:Aminotransferase n=1 Tax=Ammoniphilus oxalaticus TaxID=66863 RepID=A0A419SMT7_9BACL|nr:LL-diaminopimelate aminotransferase [Ammoniphilus oxalaticus]RKD25521.1 LL-diaminopimelate aminotransferase [Ammoniphilus oxalaticus]